MQKYLYKVRCSSYRYACNRRQLPSQVLILSWELFSATNQNICWATASFFNLIGASKYEGSIITLL